MTERFADMLQGGHHNSLGRAEEVVAIVLTDHGRLEELVNAVLDADELVRLRAGDALEKVCRERPEWLVPYAERLLGDLGAVDQPSVQWHVAQMLDHLRDAVTPAQRDRARALLQRRLASSRDWIVLNVTMEILSRWAADDPPLREWLAPQLERLCDDPRRSVARRAARLLALSRG